MALILYYARMSSASPIAWALAELGIDYQRIDIDLKGTAHKQPDFLALNPMGQVPTLVDDGQAMFESSAITIYLGEKYGVSRGLWPEVGSARHMVALTWTIWLAVTFGSSLRMVFGSSDKLGAPKELQNPAVYAEGMKRVRENLAVLDAHLATREYLTGATFTLADTLVAASLGWATQVIGFDLATTPNMAAYVKRCMARPATSAMS